jgi:Tfp pilus assembly protein PilZ
MSNYKPISCRADLDSFLFSSRNLMVYLLQVKHMQDYKERRQHKRAKGVLLATCITTDQHSVKVPITSQDISEGGLQISTGRELIPGSQLLVILQLPWIKPKLEISAEVVWVKAAPDNKDMFNVGVKFLFMNDAHRLKIKDYVERRHDIDV